MNAEDLKHYNEVNNQAAPDEFEAYESDAILADTEAMEAIAEAETELTDEQKLDLEALRDVPHRVPNRKMKRAWTRQVDEVRSGRSRIRRRVHRVRKYYASK